MKLSDLNYPEPQTVKGHIIIGKMYSLSEQADVLKILTQLHNLLGVVYLARKDSNVQICVFLFSVNLVFSLQNNHFLHS